MKIKLDENLPASLADALSKLGHDVDTVPRERLSGHPDSEIWQATQQTGRFLIIQDLHFADVRTLVPGTHRGILLVRLRDPNRRMLIERIQQVFVGEDVESWADCFVVATESKVRVRKPSAGI